MKLCAAHSTLLYLILLHCCTIISHGYSTGPDASACDHMVPGHGTPGDVGPPPFNISVSQFSFKPAETIEMSLFRTDGTTFKGFFLQARRSSGGNERIGSFVIDSSDGKTMCQCTEWPDCAVSHKDSSQKSSIDITWTAPCTFEGDITLRATMVESYTPSVYWAAIDLLTLTGEQGTGAECETEGTTVTGVATTTTPLTPIDLATCGTEKGCLRMPDGCTDSTNCDYLLTWTPNEDNEIAFEISAQVNSPGSSDVNSWAAIGLSHDTNMGDDSVTDCIYDESTFNMIIQTSWNTNDPANIPLQNNSLGLVNGTYGGSYAQGIIQCSYSRFVTNKETSYNTDQIFDLDQPYYILLAKGPGNSGVKSVHSFDPLPFISRVKVDLRSVQDIRGGGAKSNLVITHGSLMILAWLVMASVGVLMPRHLKNAWKTHKLFKEAVWFQIHRGLMTTLLTLTICAFIIIFVEIGGYSENLSGVHSIHPILGIIVMILAITNPIMALFRPHPNTPKRPIFNWAHFTVGVSAHILAGMTMLVGTRLARAGMSDWAVWLVLAVLVWHVIIELSLFQYNFCMNKSKGSVTPSTSQIDLKKSSSRDSLQKPVDMVSSPSTVELVEMNAAKQQQEQQKQTKSSTTVVVILSVHVAVLVGSAIALIVDLSTS